MKFYIVKQPLDWFGAVSQYKISLENPSVFQNHSCYFITSLNNPRYSDVNSYYSKSYIIPEAVLLLLLCVCVLRVPPSKILHLTCSAYISFNYGRILMFKVSK